MEINAANLDALFLGFNQAFQKGFTKPATFYEEICMVVPSSSRREEYPWMGRSTKMREWLGDRVIQSLERHLYSLQNRDFEETIGVDRNDIEDDIWSTLSPLFENMGWNAAVHPDQLLSTLLNDATAEIDAPSNANAVLAYDGVTMFSASGHPVGLAGGAATSYANADTSGSGPWWFIFDVSRPMKSVIFQRRKPYTFTRMNTEQDEQVFMKRQFRFGVDARVNMGVGFWQLCYCSNADLTNSNNFEKGRAALRAIKTDAGDPFGAAAMTGEKNLVLMVPSSLEGPALRLCHAELVAGGAAGPAGTGGPISNIWKGSARPVVNTYLNAANS